MKKLIFILMVFLLPSCTIFDMATGIGGIMYIGRQLEKKEEWGRGIAFGVIWVSAHPTKF